MDSLAFHALHQSCIGVDVHANLIVGVYQRAQFGKTTIEEQYWNSDAIKSSLKKFALWCKSLAPEVLPPYYLKPLLLASYIQYKI